MSVLHKIDELDILANRGMLGLDDNCYYYLTYNRNAPLYSGSPRSIIKNLKRKPSEIAENPSFSYYKQKEIQKVASLLNGSIHERQELLKYVWIPVAPSKAVSDPEYDDRLMQILATLKKMIASLVFIDPFYSIESKSSSHITNERSLEEKKKNLGCDEHILQSMDLTRVVLFDDMITTGSTFIAYKHKILDMCPNADIVGIFICKAIYSEIG